MHRCTLRCLLFAWLLVGASSAAEPGSTATMEAALSARLEQAVEQGFSGSVLVTDGRRLRFERVLGMADPAGARPVRVDTRFNLASAGKLFTSVAVMQLVEQGKLDLDVPVGRYLPDWPVASVRERVTARQLLLHTSGLGSFWGAAFEARRPRLQRISDYRTLLLDEPGFDPGSAWQYSNSGYMLLGLLIEAVSGEDYYAYISAHVFEPAGMRDSGYFAIDGIADRVARPRTGGTGRDRDRIFSMPEPRGGPAGGGYSTPRDLLRFQRAMAGGVLLDAATRATMLAPPTLPAGTRLPQGLGVQCYAVGDDLAWGHPGGAPGVGVEFWTTRDSYWTVIVMSNSDQPRSRPLVNGLFDVIFAHGGPDLHMTAR